MFIPVWLVAAGLILVLILGLMVIAFLRGRNPLPFPDFGSRIFAAKSPEAKEALVSLLAEHCLLYTSRCV